MKSVLYRWACLQIVICNYLRLFKLGVYMTNQAGHNQVVKNEGEANNRYESANSW